MKKKYKLKKFNLSKYLWIFLIGALLGYGIESFYHVIKHGTFVSKRGLLYGHIKPIYGIGTVIITLLVNMFKDKSKMEVFVFGSLVGGIFEYLCSLFLEIVFGTRMWSYANMGFDINGRVFIPYLPMWGLIAIFWSCVFIPYFDKLYNSIPKIPRKIASVILLVFLVFNITISSLAVWRMQDRNKGDKASNAYERFMDKHYPDSFIQKRVPYLKIIK